MNKINSRPGAGIILFFNNKENLIKDFKQEILYFILLDRRNRYDFTKGCTELNESALDCAVRETKEESNLSLENFKLIDNVSFNLNNCLTLYLGELRLDTMINRHNIIKYSINKSINKPEHIGHYFLTCNEVISNIYGYLKPYLLEADKFLNK